MSEEKKTGVQGDSGTGFVARGGPRKHIRETEELYSALFQNNHAVVLLIHPDSADIVDEDPAACSFYQYNYETLIKMKMHDTNSLPKDGLFEAMRQAKLENKTYFHFQHRPANNEIRDIIAKPYKMEELEEVIERAIVED